MVHLGEARIPRSDRANDRANWWYPFSSTTLTSDTIPKHVPTADGVPARFASVVEARMVYCWLGSRQEAFPCCSASEQNPQRPTNDVRFFVRRTL